jgi:hypothetical protein
MTDDHSPAMHDSERFHTQAGMRAALWGGVIFERHVRCSSELAGASPGTTIDPIGILIFKPELEAASVGRELQREPVQHLIARQHLGDA